MSFLTTAWLVTRKDLLIEVRSREIVFTTLFFAVSCVLVFAFGFVREGVAVDDAAAGILWIAIAFSGTLALGRAFERERQSETLRALMMAPVDRPALYVGKLVGVLLLLAVVEAIVVPLVALMFQAPLFGHPVLMAGLLASGTIGFAAVGTLFAAMLVRARSRDVLLPILLYPITIPVIIAGVRGTAALLQADADLPMARAWLSMLVFFDVVFITLALWTFEPDDGIEHEKAVWCPARHRRGDVRLCAGDDPARALRVDDGARAEDLLLPRALVDRDVHVGVRLRHRERDVCLQGPEDRGPSRGGGGGAHRALRADGPHHRSALGTQGVGRVVAVGRAADVGAGDVADLRGVLLLRKYGGAGSEKLSAVLALFGMANVPFVYWSVNVWRTVHPKTTVVMTSAAVDGPPVSVVLAGLPWPVRAHARGARAFGSINAPSSIRSISR